MEVHQMVRKERQGRAEQRYMMAMKEKQRTEHIAKPKRG